MNTTYYKIDGAIKMSKFIGIWFCVLIGSINLAIAEPLMLIPCSNIYNMTHNAIAVTWDPNWDDQQLTYGSNDSARNQRVFKKMQVIEPMHQLTVCNKARFDFNIENSYMTGIIVGDPQRIDYDGIALTLGIASSIANISVTDAYSFSKQYDFIDHIGVSRRTNQLMIISLH